MIPRATIDGKQLCLANSEEYYLCLKGQFYTLTFTSAKENMQTSAFILKIYIIQCKFVFKHSAAKMVTKIVQCYVEVN